MTKSQQSEYDALMVKLNKNRAEHGALMSKMRSNLVFGVKLVEEDIKAVSGKFFAHNKNPELVYQVKGGTIIYDKNFFILKLDAVSYHTVTGKITEEKYELRSSALPRDTRNWLTMGNREVDEDKAKEYINLTVKLEIQNLEKAKKTMEDNIKLLKKKLI